MKEKKPSTSYRLSRRTRELIDALAEELDVSQAAVITLAIKVFATRHKIKLPPTTKGPPHEDR